MNTKKNNNHSLSSEVSAKTLTFPITSSINGLLFKSKVSIKKIKSWKPFENVDFGGIFTESDPLCTANAILSPFSKITSKGDL